MTLLAGLPVFGCMLVMSAPALADIHELAFRLFYLVAYLVWIVPLGWTQRWLWARKVSWWVMFAVLLPISYAMSVGNALLALRFIASESIRARADWTMILGGLDGCWLALIAFCGIQAIILHRAALLAEGERLRESAQAARDAELRALRYQLQPHFLFNTLNAISALVNDDRKREASRMIACLGDFLRATLEESRGHEISVADEIALAGAYLDIERARLGDRLHVDIHTDPETLGARVPYLLLQPLIENAIRHGIAPSLLPGVVTIRFEREREQLIVRVENDSNGVAQDGGQGVGLSNVRARLQALHAGAYSLDAGGEESRWKVRITLPYVALAMPARAVAA
ncbi:MAG: histidine kinase [Xanthomonadaceae bacterium]|nr:histidine kinase [Xanthomonadaceae bacterium]